MKHFFTILLFFLWFSVYGQNPINELKENSGHQFYEILQTENEKLLIFLHGGVTNPAFQDPNSTPPLEFLIEENKDFIPMSLKHGFDLILPIVDAELDWLTKPEEVFLILQKTIESHAKKYKEIYLTGFSDGGTGSYKIFHLHPEYFAGLVVFNGYPQHNNFYKSVDRSRINNKKILFLSTQKDEMIPYEFLLCEYNQQKIYNANTFFYLAPGKHLFSTYRSKELWVVFEVLSGRNNCLQKESEMGFVRNDELIVRYTFRKKIMRKFGFGADCYAANQTQKKNRKKLKK